MSKSGVFKEVWNKNINVNPMNFYKTAYNSRVAMLQRSRDENFVAISSLAYLSTSLAKEGFCDLVIAKDRFLRRNAAFAVFQDFPFLQMFNKKWVMCPIYRSSPAMFISKQLNSTVYGFYLAGCYHWLNQDLWDTGRRNLPQEQNTNVIQPRPNSEIVQAGWPTLLEHL